MSDLISRSELINDIATYFFSDKCNLDRLGGDLREIINNQPTAYSVDKVVEELEKAKHEIASEDYCRSINDKEKCDGRNCFECCAEYLIEIVKRGGVGTETETIRDKAVKWNNNSSKRVPYEFIDYVEGKRKIGVSDDVCEWKKSKDYPFDWLVGCDGCEVNHRQGNYCPRCGKKIKIVGD